MLRRSSEKVTREDIFIVQMKEPDDDIEKVENKLPPCLLISTEAVEDILGIPGVEHLGEDIPEAEHQGNLAEVELLPVETLEEVEHLEDIPEVELHKEAGSNLAEDKQVPGQGIQAVQEGCHMHRGCTHQGGECMAGMGVACLHLTLGMAGDLGHLRKDWELLQAGESWQGLNCQCWTGWEGEGGQGGHSCEEGVQGHGVLGPQGEGPRTC